MFVKFVIYSISVILLVSSTNGADCDKDLTWWARDDVFNSSVTDQIKEKMKNCQPIVQASVRPQPCKNSCEEQMCLYQCVMDEYNILDRCGYIDVRGASNYFESYVYQPDRLNELPDILKNCIAVARAENDRDEDTKKWICTSKSYNLLKCVYDSYHGNPPSPPPTVEPINDPEEPPYPRCDDTTAAPPTTTTAPPTTTTVPPTTTTAPPTTAANSGSNIDFVIYQNAGNSQNANGNGNINQTGAIDQNINVGITVPDASNIDGVVIQINQQNQTATGSGNNSQDGSVNQNVGVQISGR